ncbi:MAG: V-type ATP synthase subunit B [Candidatus Lokiarchaeota archaeon]|nr:V-type ATP synthase subunit B [Candidatus Lokiarchaeota archaeon]
MTVIYNKINQIIGPLVFLENKHSVQYGEVVNIIMNNGESRNGKVVRLNEEVILIEIFEDTKGISATNSELFFTNDTFKLNISKDMMGGTFNSLGKPIDIETKKLLKVDIIPEVRRDINGIPINPFARIYPNNVIQTGISGIDGLFTLIRGQKLPIFSGQGISHNELAAQIVTQAKVFTDESFLIIFCGIGIIHDEAISYIDKFRMSGNVQNIISFINFADDPVMERLMIPHVALTTAEYFAFDKDMHVLVVLIDMTNYAEALRELSLAKEEIPSRKGYPGHIYSDFARIYERSGLIKGSKGSVTQIPILTMPNDDITHVIPDTTGYITDGQIVLSRDLQKKEIYPPFEILASLSRLMKDAIGEDNTREDHSDVSSQLIASYSYALDARDLVSIVGEESLNAEQRSLLKFADVFEKTFLNQSIEENRSISETLDIAWKVLSYLPKNKLNRIHKKYIEKFYQRG